MRKAGLLAAVVALFPALAAAGCSGDGDDSGSSRPGDARPVTLALDFQPNAVHAGVYTATGEDLDAARDLDLTVRAPSASADSLKLLAAGRADLAVVDIHDLGLARERGADVVGVGALVQRPLAAVIARPGIERPRDLEGRRVGVTGLPSDTAVLRAVVGSDGGDPAGVRQITIGFSAVPSLVAGRVDAVVTFWNAEGVALRRRGTPTREFRVDEFGAPRYPELVVATTGQALRRDPELVRDTVAVLAAGTRRALADRPAAAQRVAEAADADPALVEAQLDAVAAALSPPLSLDREALRRWAHFDARFGILERPPRIDEAFPPVAP